MYNYNYIQYSEKVPTKKHHLHMEYDFREEHMKTLYNKQEFKDGLSTWTMNNER